MLLRLSTGSLTTAPNLMVIWRASLWRCRVVLFSTLRIHLMNLTFRRRSVSGSLRNARSSLVWPALSRVLLSFEQPARLFYIEPFSSGGWGLGVFSPPSVASPLGWRIELALWSGYRGHSAARSFVEKSRCKKKKSPLHTPAPWAGRRSFFWSLAGAVGRLGLVFAARGPATEDAKHRPWAENSWSGA